MATDRQGREMSRLHPATGERQLIGRGAHRLALLGYLGFVWYGSLVPLNFTPMPFGEALSLFMDARADAMAMDGRTDFVVNVLLFGPVGFFAMAALRTDRQGRAGDALAAVTVVPCCVLLSMAIEFSEIFFPGRTLSFNDVIAQASGGLLGVAFWLIAGRALTDWVKEFAAEREPLALVERLLLAYCVGFVVAQLVPLDLVTNLEELAAKYRQGGIVLVPFGHEYPSATAMLWDHLWDVLLNVPLGAGALILWVPFGGRRTVPQALALSTLAIVVIECGQLVVNSRVADVTDILKGGLGAALGVLAATRLGREGYRISRQPSDKVVVMARIALPLWVLALAGYHWSPFDFVFSGHELSRGLDMMLQVPMASYYWAQEFQAFTEMLRKILLALPLGLLFHLSWPDRGRASVIRLRWVVGLVGGLGFLFVVEVGQTLIPQRFPDITDVMIGGTGILIGLWIANRLQAPLAHARDRKSVHAC